MLKWNDELCGVPVTPVAWAGGVIAKDTGRWDVLEYGYWEGSDPPNDCGYWVYELVGDGDYEGDCAPVFPPAGFAGKTDAELWAAVFGGAVELLGDWESGSGPLVCVLGGGGSDGGIIRLYAAEDQGRHAVTVDDPAALILALQNGTKLVERLRGAELLKESKDGV